MPIIMLRVGFLLLLHIIVGTDIMCHAAAGRTLSVNQQQQQGQIACNETTESLFEIQLFNVTSLRSIPAPVQPYIRWKLQVPSNPYVRPSYSAAELDSGRDTYYYAQCMSKDDCAVLSISSIGVKFQYKTLLDGEDIAPTHRYENENKVFAEQYTRVEFGPCVPECANDEALFQLEAFAALHAVSVPWKLQDLTTSRYYTSCPGYGLCPSDVATDVVRYCLPRDGCYTFFTGTLWNSGIFSFTGDGRPVTFNVTFDGDRVANLKDFHLEGIHFGGGSSCAASSNTTLATSCDVGEAFVELSLYRHGRFESQHPPNISWSFLLNGESTIKSGVFDSMEDGIIEYAHECIRLSDENKQCMGLGLTIPETFRLIPGENCRYNSSSRISYPYRLTVDGVIVAEDDFSFSASTSGRRPVVEQIVVPSCSATRLSSGAIAGIVVISLLVSGIVLVYLIWKKKR